MNPIVKKGLKYIEDRFGIPASTFEKYSFFVQSDIWITSREIEGFELKVFKRKGIRFLRVSRKGFKWTTAAMQIFGHLATKNVVILLDEEAQKFIRGQDLKIERIEDIENGQVIVKWKNDILGSAIYRDGHLKNQIPKGRRIIN